MQMKTEGAKMVFKLSSGFGDTVGREKAHTGIDLPFEKGTELRSISNGVVERLVQNDTLGNGVIIKMPDGNFAIYGHLQAFAKDLKPGEKVSYGDNIGLVGETGHATGPHLHFGLQKPNGEFIDPTHLKDSLVAASGEKQGFGGWLMEKYNAFSGEVVEAETEFILKPIGSLLKNISVEVWEWFVINLPDIMGYTTMAAGAFVILSSMAGKGGFMKPLGWYCGALILAMCILSTQ